MAIRFCLTFCTHRLTELHFYRPDQHQNAHGMSAGNWVMPVRSDKQQIQLLHRLPWLTASLYLVPGLAIAIYVMTDSHFTTDIWDRYWGFQAMNRLCPPAQWATGFTLAAFEEAFYLWISHGMNNDASGIRMRLSYVLPMLIYSTLFYWLLGWVIRKIIVKWRRRSP